MELSFNKRLKQRCEEKNNYLCIGLDIDPDRFPESRDNSLLGVEIFGKEVIDGTIDFCPIYKPNFAFYERYGSKGYALLERLIDYINGRAIVIADAKRGDIGNTSLKYAEGLLNLMGCDAITISPYMGRDSIEPFINNPTKGIFVLTLTSNLGANEIQYYADNINPLYNQVVNMANDLNVADNVGLVIGATKVKVMEDLRSKSNNLPWLIPGVGSQGGNLKKSVSLSNHNGLGIINVSRDILYYGDCSIKSVIYSARNYTKKIRNILCDPKSC